jgi:endonuclease-8
VDVLLDQGVASGIGNVYKSELLFLEGLRPLAPLGEVPDRALAGLYREARRLLAANLGGGPRRTRFARGPGERLWVYGRRGRPCYRCTATVEGARLGRHLRITYWCPRCQA